MALYNVQNLIHAYDRAPVLKIEAMKIDQASITGLIGPNGSGKSTLLRLLSFVEQPSEGRIYFDGKPGRPFDSRVRFQVTLLPQSPYLLKRNVFQNVAYGLMLRKKERNLKARVNEALAMVGMDPADFTARRWDQLSGGEAQRVALAARLILKPRVLLLDEPTASVDAASAQLIQEAALRARDRWNTTLVVASHDWQWLHQVCDSVCHIFRGNLLGSGHVSVLFGPWQEAGGQMVSKKLADGQVLKVAGRPEDSEKSVAVLSSAGIHLQRKRPRQDSDLWWVKGVLTQLTAEKGSGTVLATVTVGSMRFLAGLDTKQPPFVPGSSLWLGYNPRQVRWY